MIDKKYRCEFILPLLRSEATDAITGLTFYLETLESFIEEERDKEISALGKHIELLSTDDRDEFWAWHYPVHWEDIFATQLRSSFVVTLMSLAESHVGMVTEQACELAIAPKTPDPRQGSGSNFERHRRFLQSVIGFNRPDKNWWDSLNEIRLIRNCIVHANSTIYRSNNKNRLEALVKKLPGLNATHAVIELSSEFPKYSLTTVHAFLTELYDEAAMMCQRLIR